jgi:hypothetical protein
MHNNFLLISPLAGTSFFLENLKDMLVFMTVNAFLEALQYSEFTSLLFSNCNRILHGGMD